MAGEPIVTYVGNVTADPELRFMTNGKAVANFNLAVSHRVKKGDTWEDGATTWVRCTAWESLAENVAESIAKGTRVIVQGRQSTEEYEDREGNKRSTLTLQIEAVGPELRFATAAVTKVGSRAGGGSRAGAAQQASAAADPWAGPAVGEPPF
jgi:single-strand DNA-binding protein